MYSEVYVHGKSYVAMDQRPQ